MHLKNNLLILLIKLNFPCIYSIRIIKINLDLVYNFCTSFRNYFLVKTLKLNETKRFLNLKS